MTQTDWVGEFRVASERRQDTADRLVEECVHLHRIAQSLGPGGPGLQSLGLPGLIKAPRMPCARRLWLFTGSVPCLRSTDASALAPLATLGLMRTITPAKHSHWTVDSD